MEKTYRLRVTSGGEYNTTLVDLLLTGDEYLKQNVHMMDVLKYANNIKTNYMSNGDYEVNFDGGHYIHYTCESESEFIQICDVLTVGETRTRLVKHIEF